MEVCDLLNSSSAPPYSKANKRASLTNILGELVCFRTYSLSLSETFLISSTSLCRIFLLLSVMKISSNLCHWHGSSVLSCLSY